MDTETCTCDDESRDPACPIEAHSDFAERFGAKRAGERTEERSAA